MFTHCLLLPYDMGHGETLVCQLLHCRLTRMTVRSLQKWYARLLKASLYTLWRTNGQETHKLSTETDFFLIVPAEGTPLCTVMWPEQTGCAATTLEEQTPDRSDAAKVPQSADCLPPAQQQTVETPLGWVIGELCAVLWTSPGASMLDQGWRRTRGVWASILTFLWQRYWSHWWSL